MSGSAIASSEPNAMNRTIAAATTPTADAEADSGGCLLEMACPPSSTVKARFAGGLRRVDHPADVGLARSSDCLVKFTWRRRCGRPG